MDALWAPREIACCFPVSHPSFRLHSFFSQAFQLPKLPAMQQQMNKAAAAATAAAVTFSSEAAHAKSVIGVNGALDFGPLAGDQPGGEGTGKVRA